MLLGEEKMKDTPGNKKDRFHEALGSIPSTKNKTKKQYLQYTKLQTDMVFLVRGSGVGV